MFLVVVPVAGFQRITACRVSLAAPSVSDKVMSASAVMLVVPATAESSNAVISSFTVAPHVPDNSPVTGRASPNNDVYAVAIFYLKLQLLPSQPFLHSQCPSSRESAGC